MNILQDIERLKRTGGITILHIGGRVPDVKKHNTLQVRSNGEVYLIDRCGEIQQLGSITSTSITIVPPDSSNLILLEVQIGTVDAINLGFLDGNSVLVNPPGYNFVNRLVEYILIGNINIYSIDKGDGSPWFTKLLIDNHITLHLISLTNSDVLKIKFL